jgi:hypothetical protein
MEKIKRLPIDVLIMRVVTHQATAHIREDDLGRLEMLRGKRGLACAGRPAQHH